MANWYLSVGAMATCCISVGPWPLGISLWDHGYLIPLCGNHHEHLVSPCGNMATLYIYVGPWSLGIALWETWPLGISLWDHGHLVYLCGNHGIFVHISLWETWPLGLSLWEPWHLDMQYPCGNLSTWASPTLLWNQLLEEPSRLLHSCRNLASCYTRVGTWPVVTLL